MNNFDKPVEKAKTDAEILDALQGVKMTQDELRRSKCGSVGLAFFRAYYEKLPDEVARRLTEIDTDAVERLAAALAVNEIVRSRHFLGEHTSKEDREELLKLTTSELTSTAQVLASAVHLRQQVETAEFTRALIEQQKAAQQPPGGPLAC